MEIQLFTITNELTNDTGFKKEIIGKQFARAKIKGKNLLINPRNDNFKPDYKHSYDEYLFSCKFDLPFDVEVELSSDKNRNLNTEITYKCYPDDDESRAHTCYTYLTFWQRFIIKRKRNQLWIQQSSNIMWIINILVAIIAILAAFKSTK